MFISAAVSRNKAGRRGGLEVAGLAARGKALNQRSR